MAMRWLSLAGLSVFIGGYLIPEQNKVLFHQLENYRDIWLALAVAAEIAAGGFIIYKLAGLMRISRNADAALKKSISSLLGNNEYSALAQFEARVWYYALFMRNGATLEFAGERHFGYARNGGNSSNQLGFIIAILFELPLTHMLLHFIWSPTAAMVTSALSGWALLYMVADYRATLYRPVSLDKDGILIRCGAMANDAAIPYSLVQSVEAASGTVRRRAGVRRYTQLGTPNVLIQLLPGSSLPDLFGRWQPVEKVYLSLDEPAEFINAVRKKVFVTVG
jgi:membrane protein YdbS with pleckstrin-like domain